MYLYVHFKLEVFTKIFHHNLILRIQLNQQKKKKKINTFPGVIKMAESCLSFLDQNNMTTVRMNEP